MLIQTRRDPSRVFDSEKVSMKHGLEHLNRLHNPVEVTGLDEMKVASAARLIEQVTERLWRN